ncbi:hypothetical protein F5J12DRAFT_929714 [Pisolithus orientalis]|uniref:uncharacterized protein n=1 Tax=Pisolithus orientalis TaxID=936130 RepID=UPI002223FA6B|nr:uncharacterized protein F5J12DRAFT_929714 [Pisolithus orientalis]KAI5992021.1 hypothetical protein F5J12DRAFT_929714 [Pisolithus orientalis]
MSSVYCPVVSRVADGEWSNRADDPATYCRNGKYVALRQPKGLSLPTNEHLVLLMKSLSTRAAGKHLVITVVQCSGFHGDDDNGKQGDSGDPHKFGKENRFLKREGNNSKGALLLAHEYGTLSYHAWGFVCADHTIFQDQSRGPDAGHKSVNRQKTDRTIKFSQTYLVSRF